VAVVVIVVALVLVFVALVLIVKKRSERTVGQAGDMKQLSLVLAENGR
jgi:hypothetical protein